MDVSVVEMSNVESALASFQGQRPQYIEGGKAVKSYNFHESVESVEVLLTTNLRNMKGTYFYHDSITIESYST